MCNKILNIGRINELLKKLSRFKINFFYWKSISYYEKNLRKWISINYSTFMQIYTRKKKEN